MYVECPAVLVSSGNAFCAGSGGHKSPCSPRSTCVNTSLLLTAINQVACSLVNGTLQCCLPRSPSPSSCWSSSWLISISAGLSAGARLRAQLWRGWPPSSGFMHHRVVSSLALARPRPGQAFCRFLESKQIFLPSVQSPLPMKSGEGISPPPFIWSREVASPSGWSQRRL